MVAGDRRLVPVLAIAGLMMSGLGPVEAETKKAAGEKLAATKPAVTKASVAKPAAKPAPAKPRAKNASAAKSPLSEIEAGDQFLADSKFYQAIKCYEHAYKALPDKDPLKPRALVNLAIAQLSLGRDEDAAESMQTISAEYPAYKSLQRTHLDALFDEFRHAAEHTDEASSLLAEAKTRAAITEYEEAIEHMPYNAEFYSLLGFAYRTLYTRTKDEVAWKKAQHAFDMVKKLDPTEYDAIKADTVKP